MVKRTAARAGIVANARKAHQGGEFPKHIRPYWDQLPATTGHS